MVAPTFFGITLPSSGSVRSVFWEMLNWGVVDRILLMGVLCPVTWCVAIWDSHAPRLDLYSCCVWALTLCRVTSQCRAWKSRGVPFLTDGVSRCRLRTPRCSFPCHVKLTSSPPSRIGSLWCIAHITRTVSPWQPQQTCLSIILQLLVWFPYSYGLLVPSSINEVRISAGLPADLKFLNDK
jgi:hypothetical protein